MTVNHLLCLWPGLARLWLRGEVRSCLLALGFAGLLEGLVASTLVWTEIAPLPLRAFGLVVAALWWLAAAVIAWRELPDLLLATADDPHKGLFVAAQAEYLKGNWIEAEATLRKLLRLDPRDVECQLLLATLLRHTARLDKARQALQELSRLDAAAGWQHEIRGERELLRRMAQKERLSPSATLVSSDDTAATSGQPPAGGWAA